MSGRRTGEELSPGRESRPGVPCGNVRVRPIAALLAFLAGLPVAAAQSAGREEADRLFDEEVAASARGDFEAALRAFTASQRLSPAADTLYNIGMCFKALEDLPAAANAFRDWEQAAGAALTAAERAELDALLEEILPRVGRIAIQGGEPGATIRVDGHDVGRTPLASWIAVEPGAHSVEASLEGFETFRREAEVDAGGVIPVEARLTPVAPAVPVEPPRAPPVEAPGTPGADDAGGLGPWFWASAGIAAATGIGMAVTGGLAISYRDEFEGGGAEDADLRDTTIALRTTTDVLLGVTVAAGVTALVLGLLSLDDAEPEEPQALEAALAPGGIAVRW